VAVDSVECTDELDAELPSRSNVKVEPVDQVSLPILFLGESLLTLSFDL